MPNVHVHLHVADLEASRTSYDRFLGGPRAPVTRIAPGSGA